MTTLSPFVGNLRTAGRKFWKFDKIVSTTVFHWFTTDTGNMYGSWPPLEGRHNWTGELDWWKDQLKQMMLANFDVIYVHLIETFESQRVNLFLAYAELRAEGYDPPKIAPFLDPFGIWPPGGIDVATPAGKDAVAAHYIRFFRQYFETNTDPFAGTYLARIEDRVVLATWWVAYLWRNVERLERRDLEERLQSAFPTLGEVFSSGIWMASTALIQPDLSFSDERIVMFAGLHSLVQCHYNDVKTYHVQAGYWDQNIRNPGLFMPRGGGNAYKHIWKFVESVASETHRVYVESWNEYDEGSGIYAADPNGPHIAEFNQTGNTDRWSSTDDPFEYIRTTHAGASKINGLPPLDARILGYECPVEWAAGSSVPLRFYVRNQGNSLWTPGAGIGFGQHNEDFQANPEFDGLDDPANETVRFGGVFRGRPVTFSRSVTVPARPGAYLTRWGMFREENGTRQWFGESVEIEITIL